MKMFKCNNCKESKSGLLLKAKYSNLGYCCEYCWKTYNLRIKEIFGRIIYCK